jgi:hypothetical protein
MLSQSVPVSTGFEKEAEPQRDYIMLIGYARVSNPGSKPGITNRSIERLAVRIFSKTRSRAAAPNDPASPKRKKLFAKATPSSFGS